jgi:hypothetical protein
MQLAESCRRHRGLLGAIVALALIAVAMPGAGAHKGMVSPFTYNEHVFPILRNRCGGCHYDGGPTPMSLLSYRDAQPWAEAIREQLVSEAMPPWDVDPAGPAPKGGHTLSPRELDILIMWAGGGTPQGDMTRPPAPVTHPRQWKLGKPDLTLTMSTAQVLGAGTTEETREFVLPTGLKRTTWVRGTDLLPGDPSMVRRAVVQAEHGGVLAVWGPGDDAMLAPHDGVFALDAGARLRLTIHYKKNFRDLHRAVEDRSQIGLYFAKSSAARNAIQALELEPDHTDSGSERPRLAATAKTAMRVVALRPLLDRDYQSIAVDAVLPTGRRSLLRLRFPRAAWPRRYWLDEPVAVPPGARIEAIGIEAPLASGALPSPAAHRLQIALDFIAK